MAYCSQSRAGERGREPEFHVIGIKRIGQDDDRLSPAARQIDDIPVGKIVRIIVHVIGVARFRQQPARDVGVQSSADSQPRRASPQVCSILSVPLRGGMNSRSRASSMKA